MSIATLRRCLGAALALVLAGVAPGCDGQIMDPLGSGGGGGGPGGGGPGGGGALESTPAPSTRFARLSHEQWENAVRDLFRLDARTGLSESFRTDPTSGGYIFGNDTTSLEVDELMWDGYRRAASQLATMVSGDAAIMAEIMPGTTGDPEVDAEEFIRSFGLRVHRRPLTADQVSRYMEVYRAGAGMYEGLSNFDAGIRLLIEAFLQSPHFLYRVEQSTEAEDGLVPLDSWEIASRLSFALWNTMPDDELIAAAQADELTNPDATRAQAERMLDDPRAEDVVDRFHHQLLNVDKFVGIRPSDTFFPEVSDRLNEYVVTEQSLFIRDVYVRGGSWGDVLTATDTYVNDELARLYGLEGTYGSEFVPAELDPTQRAGVFSHLGFLASNATSAQPDPIHRGVFLAERIACSEIAAPPDDIPAIPSPDGQTNREAIETLTEDPTTVCAGCHAVIINPFGFPFESFDAVGQWRDLDNGLAVDTTAAPRIGNTNVPVSGAVELAHALADSEVVHECYAKHWVEFAFGRPEEEDYDAGLVHQLAEASHSGASIRELLAILVSDRAFLNRSTEELP